MWWQSLIKFVLIGQIAFCVLVIVLGPYGVLQLKEKRKAIASIEHKIGLMQREIGSLENEITAYQSDSFLREKIAREKLQLTYPGDEVYLIK